MNLECRLQFGKLGEMIASHPRLKEHSKFLFIPGPDDAGILVDFQCFSFHFFSIWHSLDILFLVYPGPSKVLPRCALPNYLTEEFKKNVPNAIFSSNPCR